MRIILEGHKRGLCQIINFILHGIRFQNIYNQQTQGLTDKLIILLLFIRYYDKQKYRYKCIMNDDLLALFCYSKIVFIFVSNSK